MPSAAAVLWNHKLSPLRTPLDPNPVPEMEQSESDTLTEEQKVKRASEQWTVLLNTKKKENYGSFK